MPKLTIELGGHACWRDVPCTAVDDKPGIDGGGGGLLSFVLHYCDEVGDNDDVVDL